MKIDMVSVVNNFRMYDEYFTNNEFVNKYNLTAYDNTVENLSIPLRFNDYIKNKMQGDPWIVFCHQDFRFEEDPGPVLENLDKDAIYGPVGAGIKKQLALFLRLEGIKIKKFRAGFIDKQIIKGRIVEDNGSRKKYAGVKAADNEQVNTVDCCCFIVHSSLLKKTAFRFDEKLEWHLYSEDLSLDAFAKYKIKTRIINIKATHFSSGSFDGSFSAALNYIICKYPGLALVSTCYDGAYRKFTDSL